MSVLIEDRITDNENNLRDVRVTVRNLERRIAALEQAAKDQARNSNASAIAFDERLAALERQQLAVPSMVARATGTPVIYNITEKEEDDD